MRSCIRSAQSTALENVINAFHVRSVNCDIAFSLNCYVSFGRISNADFVVYYLKVIFYLNFFKKLTLFGTTEKRNQSLLYKSTTVLCVLTVFNICDVVNYGQETSKICFSKLQLLTE